MGKVIERINKQNEYRQNGKKYSQKIKDQYEKSTNRMKNW